MLLCLIHTRLKDLYGLTNGMIIKIFGGDTLKELASKLIDFRARNNLTQKEVAKMCGMSTKTILMVENGKYTAKPVTVRKIEIKIEEYEKGV